MFSGCSSLTSLDLSGFDTSNVELMSSMFYGCTSLESVDLSSFDTANVRIMYGAFRDYSSLESLDLSGFDTSSVFDADEALAGCISLTSVKVGPKTLANLSLPSEDVDGHADWYSEDADRWFTSEQIDAGRKTFSDVYMKSAPPSSTIPALPTPLRTIPVRPTPIPPPPRRCTACTIPTPASTSTRHRLSSETPSLPRARTTRASDGTRPRRAFRCIASTTPMPESTTTRPLQRSATCSWAWAGTA